MLETVFTVFLFPILTLLTIYIVQLIRAKIKDINTELNGEDLQALGLPQGKLYKEIFEYLIEQKISGKILTKEDEILAVKRKFL